VSQAEWAGSTGVITETRGITPGAARR
jgi:hypothetical protein